MKIPPRGKLYSLNEGYEASWDESTTEYVKSKKFPKVNNSFNLDMSCVVRKPVFGVSDQI